MPVLYFGYQQCEVTSSAKNSYKPNDYREMLAKHFPDFEERVLMEKHQAEIYLGAVRKIEEYEKVLRTKNGHERILTADEQSAIDYFHGVGKYAKFQDPKVLPNIFDTRKTFLKKMENRDMREKFLKAYNRRYPIE